MRLPKTIELNLKITHAAILAVSVAALVTAYVGMSRSRAVLQRMVEVHDPLNKAVSEMEVNVIQTGDDALKYLATSNPKFRADSQTDSKEFDQLKAQYDRLAYSERLTESGYKLAAIYPEYRRVGDRVMKEQDRGHAVLERLRAHLSVTGSLLDEWSHSPGAQGDECARVLSDMSRQCGTALALLSVYKHDHSGEFAASFSRIGKELYESRIRLQKIAHSSDDRRRLGEISDPLQKAISDINELAALFEQMRSDTALLGDLQVSLDELLHGEIQGIVAQDLNEVGAAAKKTATRTLFLLGLLIPAVVVVSGALGRRVLRSITDPLKALAEGATAIGEGETSRRIPLEGPREFTTLAEQFNVMAEHLESTMVSKAELQVKEETLRRTYKVLQQEVDERTRTAAALHESQERMRRAATEWQQMFDCIESPFIVLDANGRCHRANRAALRLCGGQFTASGPKCGEAGLCPLADSFGIIIRQLREGITPVSIQKKDEMGRTWQLDGVQLRDTEAGERFIILVRDLTQLVTMQETLHRTERMSAMGALVSAVAHEVRNPLFILTATLEVVDAIHVVGPEAQEYFETIRQQVGRLDTLMRDLLEYGKPAPVELSPGNLVAIIEQAAAECGPLAERLQVYIDNRVDPQLPEVPMDPNRLVQVFRNIIENAIQHSPQRSRVRIEARCFREGGSEWVECNIRDQGKGFRPEDLDRLFLPFFTRREGGTGLGLAISQRIVDAHAGRLTILNAPEGGAVARICFRVAENLENQHETKKIYVQTQTLIGR